MFNLDTLDTLIAIVVVLFVLSLVVQAIQSGIKKLFKIKSRQLEESLVDLFENVLTPSAKGAPDRLRMPTLCLLPFVKLPSELASDEVKVLFNAVMKEFTEIGRVASSGRRMLESLSKEDLMKILQKLGAQKLCSTFTADLEKACEQFMQLKEAIEGVKMEHFTGEASAKFAKVLDALMPSFNDIQCFFKSDEKGVKSLNKELLLGNVLGIRNVRSGDVLDLLGEVQRRVGEDLANQPDDAAIKELDRKLNGVAASFAKFQKSVDELLSPLRIKMREVENWYDTVMRSFEERYNRGMKTYAFIISLIVAVWLNANIFNVYQDISANAHKRAAIVGAYQGALQRYQEQLAVPEVVNDAKTRNALSQLIEATTKDIEKSATEYAKFGFKPWGEDVDKLLDSKEGWLSKLAHLMSMLLGWMIMAALLSIGAPFWNDTLESLFGVKNLLRKKGNDKNAETAVGQVRV